MTTNTFNPTIAANWLEVGFEITRSSVARQAGEHRTDRVTMHRDAFIPRAIDAKLIEASFPGLILAAVNGTSIRVTAQDVSRSGIEHERTDGEILTSLYNRLRGIRNGGSRVSVTKLALLDGTTFSGDDLENYRRASITAAMRTGLDEETATIFYANLQFPK